MDRSDGDGLRAIVHEEPTLREDLALIARAGGRSVRLGRIGMGVLAILGALVPWVIGSITLQGGPAWTALTALEPTGVPGSVIDALAGRATGPIGWLENLTLGVGASLIRDDRAWTVHGFAVLSIGWLLLVGLILSRSIAVELGARRRLSTLRALAFLPRRGPAVLGGAAAPALLLLGLWQASELLEWLLGASLGAWLALPLAVAAGAIALLLAIGLPMMPAACAFDGTDVFGTIERPIAYVIRRPATALLLVVWSALLGVLGLLVGASGVWVAGMCLPEPTEGNAEAIHAARAMPTLLLLGWVVSYLSCTTTAIYAAQRRRVDAVDVERVWNDDALAGVFTVDPQARREDPGSAGASDRPA